MLQPTVRRTWAPKGQTPIHYSWDRRDRLSVVSAVTLSPRRRRFGLYFNVLRHNVRTDDFERFICATQRSLRKPITLIMDRYSVHRAAAKRLRDKLGRRIVIEWLPPYAPDLNPDEQVWNRAKYTDLANYLPQDIDTLDAAVTVTLRRMRDAQPLLRSFFDHAKLNL